jgi:hypothetical protein
VAKSSVPHIGLVKAIVTDWSRSRGQAGSLDESVLAADAGSDVERDEVDRSEADRRDRNVGGHLTIAARGDRVTRKRAI